MNLPPGVGVGFGNAVDGPRAVVHGVWVVYFSIDHCLLQYAYRISPGLVLFAVPIVAVVLIAAATITTQVLRTARANPSDSLKHE